MDFFAICGMERLKEETHQKKTEYYALSQTMQAIWSLSLGYRRLIVEGENSTINKKTSNLRLRHSTHTIVLGKICFQWLLSHSVKEKVTNVPILPRKALLFSTE